MQIKTRNRLRRFNLGMGVLHLLQGIAMLTFSNDFVFTIYSSFFQFNEELGRPVQEFGEKFIEFNAGAFIALFLFLSAFFHFLIASPIAFDTYISDLKKNINKFRWYEYALSSSIMIVAIGILSGVNELASVILIFVLNGVMNLFGLMMELHNQKTEKTNWTAFIFGCIAGIVPWIAIAIYFFSAISSAGDAVPTFVYFILVTLFLFFNTFAINMFLQYKKVGPWKNYLFGEGVYIFLSLTAKTALAWQVFFGTMRPE